jgi:hypothetical protein
MQQNQRITDHPPTPFSLPPRKRMRDLRDEALRISGVVQVIFCCVAIGAALSGIIMRANATGMAFGILLMGLATLNALLVQSSICTGTPSVLFVLSRSMVRSRSRIVRSIGSVLRKACAKLPIWAGGTATLRRLRMAAPYRLEASRMAKSNATNANVEAVYLPVESKRGENLSPIAATHVALGTSPLAVAARRHIESESRRAAASKNPTEDDELWIAAGAMLRMVFDLGMTEERLASLQSSIARWMSGLIAGWPPDQAPSPVRISPDDAWRLERFSSQSLAFIAVAGSHGANVGKADVAIHILFHRSMGYAGTPVFDFITAPDTQPPGAVLQGVDQEAETPKSPPKTTLADANRPWVEQQP